MSKTTSSPTLRQPLINDGELWNSSKQQEDQYRSQRTSDGGHRVFANPLNKIWLLSAQLGLVVIVSTTTPATQAISAPAISGYQDLIIQEQSYTTSIHWILETTKLSKERIAKLLGTTRPSLDAWLQGRRIRDRNRQRIFATQEILRRISNRYSTHEALVAWLDTPRGSNNLTPAQLLGAGEIDAVRALAISTPSKGLGHTPDWIGRPVAEAFRVEEEILPGAASQLDSEDEDISSGVIDEEEEWETF